MLLDIVDIWNQFKQTHPSLHSPASKTPYNPNHPTPSQFWALIAGMRGECTNKDAKHHIL